MAAQFIASRGLYFFVASSRYSKFSVILHSGTHKITQRIGWTRVSLFSGLRCLCSSPLLLSSSATNWCTRALPIREYIVQLHLIYSFYVAGCLWWLCLNSAEGKTHKEPSGGINLYVLSLPKDMQPQRHTKSTAARIGSTFSGWMMMIEPSWVSVYEDSLSPTKHSWKLGAKGKTYKNTLKIAKCL